MKLFCFSYWNTWQMSTCGARSRVLWVPWNPSVPLASDGSWYGLAMWLCTITYANYQAGRAPSIAFVGEGDNIIIGPTTPHNGHTKPCQTSWRRLGRESGMEDEFSLVCQRTDDGDDGACVCCSIQDNISTTCVQAVMHFIVTFFKLHAKMTCLG